MRTFHDQVENVSDTLLGHTVAGLVACEESYIDAKIPAGTTCEVACVARSQERYVAGKVLRFQMAHGGDGVQCEQAASFGMLEDHSGIGNI